MYKFKEGIKGIPVEIKSGTIYTFSVLITKGLTFITIPIFTRIMSTEEIGNVNLYNSWFSMISILSTLSLTSGGYQLALKEFSDKKNEYDSSVLSITTMMSLVITFFYLLLSDFLNQIIDLPKPLIWLLLIGIIVSPAQDFWMARQRFEYKYKLAAFLSVASAVAASFFSIVVVIYQNAHGGATAEGRLFANNIIMYGFSLLIWIFIMTRGRTIYNREYWKYSLGLSIPLMGHAIAKQILDVSDRIMINYYEGKSAVGIYGTLYTVSAVSLVVWNALNASFVPYLFKNIDFDDKKKKIQNSSSLLLMLYACVAVFMTYLAPEIVRIIATEEYYEAIYIMPPIAMGVSLTAVSNMFSNVLIYYKKTKIIMIASCTAAISNIILNAIFIPLYGYQAAAYTTLLSYILLTIIEAFIGTNTYKKVTGKKEMVYSNKLIIAMCLITMILSFLGLCLYQFKYLRYVTISIIAIVVGIFIKRKFTSFLTK